MPILLLKVNLLDLIYKKSWIIFDTAISRMGRVLLCGF